MFSVVMPPVSPLSMEQCMTLPWFYSTEFIIRVQNYLPRYEVLNRYETTYAKLFQRVSPQSDIHSHYLAFRSCSWACSRKSTEWIHLATFSFF